MLHHVCDVACDRHSVEQSELVNLGTQTDYLYGYAHCFLSPKAIGSFKFLEIV